LAAWDAPSFLPLLLRTLKIKFGNLEISFSLSQSFAKVVYVVRDTAPVFFKLGNRQRYAIDKLLGLALSNP
jgi:hypothetical protein